MFFWCHLGNSVEKTAVILPHLYIIGLKIVLRAAGKQYNERTIKGERTKIASRRQVYLVCFGSILSITQHIGDEVTHRLP